MFFGVDLTQAIEVLGYPGIFAIILAESGLFFAVSLPGGSLLFTSGLLASQGFLNIYILLATVVVAAVLGDTVGYTFGSWVGPALWRRPDSRFFKKAYLEQTRDFFNKHGSRTILLARFIPIVRTFAPILAGVAQMNYRTFLFYNFIGAILWGGGFVLGGYLLGEVVPGIDMYLEYFIIGIVFVTMIPFLLHVRSARNAQKDRTLSTVSAPKAIIFDMDDTLADSFTPPSDEVLQKLLTLAQKRPIAIMSGAAYSRMERDVLKRIPHETMHLEHFYVFSDSAAQCHRWEKSEWREVYSYPLAPEERLTIEAAIKKAITECNLYEGAPNTARILDRETSVAFAALPEGATQLEKRAWDEDGAKRQKLAKILRTQLPEFEILIGGKTTVDITRQGITKAHGVQWLSKQLNLAPHDMLFIGDGFGEGGNDAVVLSTGIKTREVVSPSETLEIITNFLKERT